MTNRRNLPTLAELSKLNDTAARGRKLELFVANLFRERHFTVIVNSHAAKPRQTDLLAVKVAERYLVECKWQNRPASIHDLDSLRSRLQRTSPDVVGLLISMNGFTDEVPADVQHQRNQPVLLLSGDELRDIEAGYRHSLPALLFQKKERLLRDAHVMLDEPRKAVRRPRRLPYPQPGRHFVLSGQASSLVCVSAGEFGRVCYTISLPDIDWSLPGGTGVALNLRLEIADEAELLEVLDVLVDLGWTTGEGCWSIQQSSRNWHGLGIEELIRQLPKWRVRAEHHTEEITYTDRCDNGFYALAADLSASSSRRAYFVELSFQLEGFSLDSGPLLHLARTLGVHENLCVRPRAEKSVNYFRPKDQNLELAVRGFIVEEDSYFDGEDGPWAVGIIAENPYYGLASQEREQLPNDLITLTQNELVLCDLANWHPLKNPRPRYELRVLEWAWASETFVCRLIADWPDERPSSLRASTSIESI